MWDWADTRIGARSTGQAETHDSDCILRPVFSCPDPIRGSNSLLVLCEVMNPDGTPHATNTRAQLRAVLDAKVTAEAPLFGFEQEYSARLRRTASSRRGGFDVRLPAFRMLTVSRVRVCHSNVRQERQGFRLAR